MKDDQDKVEKEKLQHSTKIAELQKTIQ